MRLDRDSLLALRALRDCVVVRARWSDPGFQTLRALRLASYVPIPRTDLADHRLTQAGHDAARDLLKGETDV